MSEKPRRIDQATLRAQLKSKTVAALDTPHIEWAMWLPRTTPLTTGIVVLLCTIHALTGLGDIETIRAKWGLDLGTPLSWLTHAFLHTDIVHLTENTFIVFLPFGGLVELSIGRTKLAIIVVFTAIAAAVMSGIAVPEYWETKSNPVGFSAVAQAISVLGLYMAGRVSTIWVARKLTTTRVLKKFRAWSWAALGTIVGLTAAGIWLALLIGNEWNGTDAAPNVAHSFGLLTGAMITLLIASSADQERNPLLGKPVMGFTIAVIVVAALAVLTHE